MDAQLRTAPASVAPQRARGRGLRTAVAIGLLLCAPVALSGCAAIGLMAVSTAMGVGAGTAVGYTLNGVAYRTFAAPLPKVERATLVALKDMGLTLAKRTGTADGKEFEVKANDREVSIVLETVSPKTTRMRTVVRKGQFLKDRATATEIIIQTERVLGSA